VKQQLILIAGKMANGNLSNLKKLIKAETN